MTIALSPTAPFRETAIALLGDKPKLLLLAAEIERIASRIASLEITNDDEAELVNDLLGGAKLAFKALSHDRKKEMAPYVDKAEEIAELFRPSVVAFKALEELARNKIKAHIQVKQEAAARKLEASADLRAIAEKSQLDAIEKLGSADTDEARAEAEVLVDTATTAIIAARRAMPSDPCPSGIRSNYANSTLQYRMVPVITNIKLIPREYLEQACELGAKLKETDILMRVLRKAAVGIPGVVMVEEPGLVTRVGLQ